MTIEQVFQAKPEDPETETALEQLAKLISGKVPCDDKGEVDWTELGALCGDKAKSVLDSCGVIVRDGDQANDVLIGAGVSLLKVLYENRDRLLPRKQSRDLKMALGFAEALGLPEKIAGMLIKHRYTI